MIDLSIGQRRLLYEIIKSVEAREAIASCLNDELDSLMSRLRQAVRTGREIEAAGIEGQMHALEGVIPILEKAVATYREQESS